MSWQDLGEFPRTRRLLEFLERLPFLRAWYQSGVWDELALEFSKAQADGRRWTPPEGSEQAAETSAPNVLPKNLRGSPVGVALRHGWIRESFMVRDRQWWTADPDLFVPKDLDRANEALAVERAWRRQPTPTPDDFTSNPVYSREYVELTSEGERVLVLWREADHGSKPHGTGSQKASSGKRATKAVARALAMVHQAIANPDAQQFDTKKDLADEVKCDPAQLSRPQDATFHEIWKQYKQLRAGSLPRGHQGHHTGDFEAYHDPKGEVERGRNRGKKSP